MKPLHTVDVGRTMRVLVNADYQVVDVELHFERADNVPANNFMTIQLDDTEAVKLANALLDAADRARKMSFPN